IDAIKYIDGTEIKDVRMEGDKTVKVGVATDKQPTAVISGEKISFNDISFNIEISDEMKLLERSGGRVDAVFYEGDTIIETRSLNYSEVNEIVFDNLKIGTEYTYVIAASYDALDGKGFDTYILASKTFDTLKYLMFDDVEVSQTVVYYSLKWHSQSLDGEIKSVALYQGETKIKDIEATATEIGELLSDNEYTIIVEYTHNGKVESVYLTFTTVAKAKPIVDMMLVGYDKTSAEIKVEYTDTDNVGSISKIELWHKAPGAYEFELVVEGDSSMTEFTHLLSNNQYVVKLIYTYDLNNGKGLVTRTVECPFRTLWKENPYIEIFAYSTQNYIGFDFSVSDEDNTFFDITKIELLWGEDGILVADSTSVRDFTDLEPYTEYTIKVTFTVDMNDGRGLRTRSIKKTLYTQPYFELQSVTMPNNTEPVAGDSLLLQIDITNPSKLMAKSVIVNGKKYAVVSALTNADTICCYVDTDESFEGGNTTFTVECIDFEGAVEIISYTPEANNTVSG
ncbi:MAG: hypothetical protein J6A83_09190, partial [Clostridia bacterium]|nr:hypothetical protein [Clostridia bacterium]